MNKQHFELQEGLAVCKKKGSKSKVIIRMTLIYVSNLGVCFAIGPTRVPKKALLGN
jgi:hypothetical protein